MTKMIRTKAELKEFFSMQMFILYLIKEQLEDQWFCKCSPENWDIQTNKLV